MTSAPLTGHNNPVRQGTGTKNVSKKTNKELAKEAVGIRRSKVEEAKVVLLGQTESGKSTLLKHFQERYTPETTEEERLAWRPTILLKIIRALQTILDELDLQLSREHPSSSNNNDTPSPSSPLPQCSTSESQLEKWKVDIPHLRSKLQSLTDIEGSLSDLVRGPATLRRRSSSIKAGLQSLVSRLRDSTVVETPEASAIETLSNAQDHITELWKHPAVNKFVKSGEKVLEGSATHFLNDISRIAVSDYVPTTEDISNAKVQTPGVSEHSIQVSVGDKIKNLLLHVVSGTPCQRHAWASYLEGATAVVFLAPVNAFDQYLEKEPRSNRLEYSLELWNLVCSNPFHKNAQLVLVLNKTDLLREKLDAGAKVRDQRVEFCPFLSGNKPTPSTTASNHMATGRTHTKMSQSIFETVSSRRSGVKTVKERSTCTSGLRWTCKRLNAFLPLSLGRSFVRS